MAQTGSWFQADAMSLSRDQESVMKENETAVPLPDKSSWKGWAEIENDPVIFNTLLCEWGVKGVKVNEIVPLDALYECTPESTYGLVFLSRWTGHEKDDSTTKVPTDLWFANQISTYSCASVAIMNIISNVPCLNLGPVLSKFITSTKPLSAKDKGLQLDAFHHVRSVHNSFATAIDMLIIDHQLAENLQDEEAKQARAQKRLAQQKRKAERDAQYNPPPAKSKHERTQSSDQDEFAPRPKRKRPLSSPKKPQVPVSESDSDSGFHFTAYLPFQQHLWRLDGLRRDPECLGHMSSDLTWLEMAAASLAAQWESAAASNIEFSLLSLVKRDGDVEREREIEEADVERAKRLREDWGPALAEVVRILAEEETSTS